VVLGQWGPGFEVGRDVVEVGTAAGSWARESTSAISWSPNSLLLVRVVRRCDVSGKPALMANPMARPFFGADPVIQLGTAVPSRLVCGGLDQARRYPRVAGLRCHPEIMEISRVWSSFNHLNGGDSDRRSVKLCEQPMGSHHAVSPVLLGLRRFLSVGGEESLGDS
jgi:hypothetical protein